MAHGVLYIVLYYVLYIVCAFLYVYEDLSDSEGEE